MSDTLNEVMPTLQELEAEYETIARVPSSDPRFHWVKNKLNGNRPRKSKSLSSIPHEFNWHNVRLFFEKTNGTTVEAKKHFGVGETKLKREFVRRNIDYPRMLKTEIVKNDQIFYFKKMQSAADFLETTIYKLNVAKQNKYVINGWDVYSCSISSFNIPSNQILD